MTVMMLFVSMCIKGVNGLAIFLIFFVFPNFLFSSFSYFRRLPIFVVFFLLLATEDDTEVKMLFPDDGYIEVKYEKEEYSKNDVLNVKLNRLDTFQVINARIYQKKAVILHASRVAKSHLFSFYGPWILTLFQQFACACKGFCKVIILTINSVLQLHIDSIRTC